MAAARPLILEQFEDRVVPATFNVPWPDATSLTLSFAPDGTDAAGQRGALFRTLGSIPTAVWQAQVLRAFQTWAAVANINVTVVSDGGQAFATLGLKEGDPRFGDIRVGALPMAGDTLAVADPYDPFIADTSVGDVFLNSSVRFSVGGGGGTYDLYSVLLHEAGHVLGLAGSSDPNSPMFEQYHKVTGLTPGDVAAIRALYGARPTGTAPPPGGNDNPWSAAPGSADPLGGAELLATTPGYVEHTYYETVGSLSAAALARSYRVRSPDLGSGLTNVMTVVVHPLGAGGAPVKAVIYDAWGNRVNATVIADGGAGYEIQVPGVLSNRDYLVQVISDRAVRYEVDIDFSMDARHLQPFVSDTLTPDAAAVTRVLQVNESQQFQFVLSASDWGAAAATGVRMTIADAAGRTVFDMAVASGASRFAEVFLNLGRYTVRFTRTAGAAVRTPVLFELSGLSASDSLGPQLRDTTLAPANAPSAALPAPSFFWLPAGRVAASPGTGAAAGLSAALVPAASVAPVGRGPDLAAQTAGLVMSPEGPALVQAPQPSAAPAALRTAHDGADDAPPAPARGQDAPPAVTQAGRAVADAALVEPQVAGRAAAVPDTDASAGTESAEVMTSVVATAAAAPALEAGAARMDRLLWFGLGATALGWLTHRAAWVGVLAPAYRRLAVRKKSERGEVIGP